MQPENPSAVPTSANVTAVTGSPLDPVISDIPWADAFTIGVGVDAVTGSVMGSAIKPVTLTEDQVMTSESYVSIVSRDSEMSQEIDASVSGKFNIESVPVDASASYLSKVQYSATALTFVAHYVASTKGYDESADYEFTDQARALLSDGAAFRNAYGDYFVAGGRRSARFTAVYVCQGSSAGQMQQFAGKVGASPELFSAEGSAKFDQEAASSHVEIKVDVVMDGYEGTPPDGGWNPQNVLEKLSWFKDKAKGAYSRAKLRHYSTLAPQYSRSVAVDPDVFSDLRQLYVTLWTLRARFQSCPKHYQELYQAEFQKFDSGVVANQALLPTDKSKRDYYAALGAQIQADLGQVLDRMDFYRQVKACIHLEPKNGVEIDEGTGQQTWTYGFDAYPQSAAVVIHTTPIAYKGDGTTLGSETHVFQYTPGRKALIVGWQVNSNYHDGTNGSWSKSVDQILLTGSGAVTAKADFNRCFNWSVTFHSVDAADYQFD